MEPPATPLPVVALGQTFMDLVSRRFDWAAWEHLVRRNGYVVDRPRRSRHPVHSQIVYPIDYGYIHGTDGGDQAEIDLFVGTADNGLVGLIVTTDFRKGDREYKLIYNCTPEEIYLVNGFLNFDRTLMEGTLILRYPMHRLWEGSI